MSFLSDHQDIDTPALLIDLDITERNIRLMQHKADDFGVALRPHTKTHKMPYIAAMQLRAGAVGISVAKTGEAEAMASAGMGDIFIANEIVGKSKLARILSLHRAIRILVGVDCVEQIDAMQELFSDGAHPLPLRIEIEVGEERSGVTDTEQALTLARRIRRSPGLELEGIFCHEGHCYRAASIGDLCALAEKSQRRMLEFAAALRADGEPLPTVSIGSTPSMLRASILPGITEIRPGTYALMDAAQGRLLNDYSRCSATVLATVISRPTDQRVILDSGAKALTAQKRGDGVCHTPGNGRIKNSDIYLSGVFDEHGIIIDRELCSKVAVGDKLEIIPNHICPCVNLYDKAYLLRGGKVVEIATIAGRGKSQ